MDERFEKMRAQAQRAREEELSRLDWRYEMRMRDVRDGGAAVIARHRVTAQEVIAKAAAQQNLTRGGAPLPTDTRCWRSRRRATPRWRRLWVSTSSASSPPSGSSASQAGLSSAGSPSCPPRPFYPRAPCTLSRVPADNLHPPFPCYTRGSSRSTRVLYTSLTVNHPLCPTVSQRLRKQSTQKSSFRSSLHRRDQRLQ